MAVTLSASRPGAGSRRTRATPNMNVTPLVDVVLVLLIIFMVVTPLLHKQFWLNLPKQDATARPPAPGEPSVVLTVDARGAVAVNGAAVATGEVSAKVSRILAARSDKVVYFDATDDAPYAVTVDAMDQARRGGAKTIAILTKKVVR
jgi:biopolymer transport protein TolR